MPTDVNALAFDEIRTFLDGKRLNKTFKQEIGNLAIQVDALIRHRVFEVYKVDQNKLKSASSVAGKSSVVDIGANVFKTSILYKHKPVGLSQFFTSAEWGNINLPAIRQGRVHTVTIKRGSPKISYGKEHRGGFIPRESIKGKVGKQSQFLNKNAGIINRRNMYERTGADRNSRLRLLFAPSPAMMAGYLLNNDENLIQQIVVAEDKAITAALNYYYLGK